MGLIIALLLAAILCTMVFGPAPVLVIVGLGIAYGLLLLAASAVGEFIASFRKGRGASTPKQAKLTAAERRAYDAAVFAEWAARQPEAAARADEAAKRWKSGKAS